jgi:glycosyltransferase involved in cell wall biosynthesis
VLHNGIDLSKFRFRARSKSTSLAFLGFVNYRKNPAFLLQILARLVKLDPAYTLYVGGTFQDLRFKIYFDHMVRSLGLTDNIVFDGWIDDVEAWLEDKDYILSTSIFESFGMSIAQGMSKGLKPIVHNWPGASGIYPSEMLFDTLDEAIEMIVTDDIQSASYREFIVRNYSLDKQLMKMDGLLRGLLADRLVADAA